MPQRAKHLAETTVVCPSDFEFSRHSYLDNMPGSVRQPALGLFALVSG